MLSPSRTRPGHKHTSWHGPCTAMGRTLDSDVRRSIRSRGCHPSVTRRACSGMSAPETTFLSLQRPCPLRTLSRYVSLLTLAAFSHRASVQQEQQSQVPRASAMQGLGHCAGGSAVRPGEFRPVRGDGGMATLVSSHNVGPKLTQPTLYLS